MSETEVDNPPPTTEPTAKSRWRRPAVLIPVILVALGLLVAAALAFQPWRLVLDQTVDEAVPTAATAAAAAAAPTTTLSGQFISHEHDTQGTAQVLETADGQRVLRLEGLRTSNGPDLKVWLSDAPVLPGTDGWFVFDDGEYVDLGALKGNVGNQNYAIPADVDLTDLSSVTIWCDRFNVSFGAAELTP